MIELINELRNIHKELHAATEYTRDFAYGLTLDPLLTNIKKVEDAWCGSWFGYRANVYYKDFGSPPLGMFFSHNWENAAEPMSESVQDSVWHRYPEGRVKDMIEEGIEKSDIRNAFDHTLKWTNAYKGKKEDVLAIIGIAQDRYNSRFDGLANQIEKLHIQTIDEIVKEETPDQMETDDPVARQQGIRIPPHIEYKARVDWSIRAAGTVNEFATLVGKTIGQMERIHAMTIAPQITGTKIFIGHGRDRSWIELRDFIKETLCLPISAYEEEPSAGSGIFDHVLSRISEAAIAFLVMTGEDTLIDKEGKEKLHPRLNVVHELGICQSRLGQMRAIALVEKGCEVPTNIIGINYIPFEKGNILCASQGIRAVLEREKII